jgi:hypothetical protein
MEQTASPKYRAFISYSHRDAVFGRQLHRRLEAYALPHRLIGKRGRFGSVPPCLRPIFRDSEELPAADSLSAEVRCALADSACLIVICSPAAARSRWVAREIDTFRALHPDRPILAVLIMGEPEDAFPIALRHAGVEPLAADFRPGSESGRWAFLRLVAGLVGVGLDDLVQRESRRRIGRLRLVGAGVATALLGAGASAAIALNSQTEAAIQAESERQLELIELYGRLADAGKPELFRSLGRPLLQEFAAQDLRVLPRRILAERAELFTGLGQDDIRRGDVEAATAKFKEANRTTAVLIAAKPKDPNNILLRAEAVRGMASVQSRGGQLPAARRSLLEARTLASQLTALRPGIAGYEMMLADTEWRLCEVSKRRWPWQAEEHCIAAYEAVTRVTRYWSGNTNFSSYLAAIQKTLDDVRAEQARGSVDSTTQ